MGTSIDPAADIDRIDRIGQQLGLGHHEVARALGVDQSTYFRWRTGASVPRGAAIRSRMEQFLELAALLRRLFDGPDLARQWLREATPASLGGAQTPLQVMEAGRLDRVLMTVQSLAIGG